MQYTLQIKFYLLFLGINKQVEKYVISYQKLHIYMSISSLYQEDI